MVNITTEITNHPTVIDFVGFPKITRYANVTATITEKLDGSNACIVFDEDGRMFCQSRKNIITPGKQTDNYGFAAWAHANRYDLFNLLGRGRHYGEWWGQGIQRNYGLTGKRFSLFNTYRWDELRLHIGGVDIASVPVICRCQMDGLAAEVRFSSTDLNEFGSRAVPGFRNPEGLMVHVESLGYLKAPFDPTPKLAA